MTWKQALLWITVGVFLTIIVFVAVKCRDTVKMAAAQMYLAVKPIAASAWVGLVDLFSRTKAGDTTSPVVGNTPTESKKVVNPIGNGSPQTVAAP